MNQRPNKITYILITGVLLVAVFLLGNAQFHNGNLFDFGSGFENAFNKVISSFGHLMIILVISSYLTYRSHKISLEGDIQSLGLHAVVIIVAAFISSVITLVISSSGMVMLTIPAFFLGSLVWFAFLEFIINFIFKFLNKRVEV